MKKNKLMMRTIVAILLMALLPYVSSAQTIKFNMGPELKTKARIFPNRFVHGDKNSSYLLTSTLSFKPVLTLNKFDGKFNLGTSKEFGASVKDLYFRDLVWCGNKFVMFSSRFDNKEKTLTAYANFVDANCNMDSKTVTLMTLQVDKKRNTGNFDFSISDDSTKILVYANPPYEKDGNEKFLFDVYSNDLVKQWEKIVTLPYKDKMITIEDQTVSNKGDVFILIKKYDEESALGIFNKEAKKTEKGKEANYKYEVLAYTNQGKDFKEYTLDLKGKFVIDPTFKVDPKGNLAVAGFYSDKLYGSEKGVFYMTVDAETKEVKAANTKEFTKEMIDAFGKNNAAKQSKGKDQGLRNFVFRDFILRDDGGAVILAENYYVISYYVSDGKGGGHWEYHYYYNDVIAINVNPKGEIEWFSRIPKRQTAGAPMPYLGFSSMVVGDKIYIIYNDNKKNTADNDKTKYFNYKDGVAVIVTIDAKGQMTKKPLFELKDNKTILYSRIAQQTTANSMTVYTRKGKNYRIGSITVDDKGASASGSH